MAKLPDEWREREASSDRVVAIAWFESRCAWCDEQIFEGDTICKTEDGWMHDECEETMRDN